MPTIDEVVAWLEEHGLAVTSVQEETVFFVAPDGTPVKLLVGEFGFAETINGYTTFYHEFQDVQSVWLGAVDYYKRVGHLLSL